MKIATRLIQFRKRFPKGPTKHGELYAGKKLISATRRVTLYTLFESDEGTHMLRPHVFTKQRHMTAPQWAGWFSEHLQKVHREGVLPGLSIRTGKHWAVKQILGWVSNAQYATRNPRVDRKGHKAKSPRSARG